VPVLFRAWSTRSDSGRPGFDEGTARGTQVRRGALTIGRPVGAVSYIDPFGDGSPASYDHASWLSPWVPAPFGAAEVVASWNATTPVGTWVQVEVRGATTAGDETGWYVLGRWASYDEGFHRTSVVGQADDHGSVRTDTLVSRDGRAFGSYQLRLTLCRLAGTSAAPTVMLLGAMASAGSGERPVDLTPGVAVGRVLDVPAYSQEIHRGEYPPWDGGGEAWCSPASTAMVLDHWGRGPGREETSWVDPAYADPQVDHAARQVYDHAYGGAGNWSFNVAYAGSRGLTAFVTRLRSLGEAERFIARGVPLVLSVSFRADELDGAGYATAGHLMVLVGFDRRGDPVLNDPASHRVASNDKVRVTFDRAQLERAWARSNRTAYVIVPPQVALPEPSAQAPRW